MTIAADFPVRETSTSSAALLALEGVGVQFGERTVLQDVHLNIRDGEFVAVVGRSGCGKTTLLRLLAGLQFPTQGEVRVRGVQLAGPRTACRIMFQDSRLLPWQKVLANVELGLRREARSRALSMLAEVGLADRKDEWPAVLSGGQRQRVALARALASDPDLLLLDEPLASLDALTRIEMQQLIERLWRQKGFAAVLVTHDVEEALLLADRVVLLENGRVALDMSVSLTRPRRRDRPEFVQLVFDLLERLLARD
jgi:sulfonate transport system ATP-binding protein